MKSYIFGFIKGNYEWLFSGLGIFLLSFITIFIKKIKYRQKRVTTIKREYLSKSNITLIICKNKNVVSQVGAQFMIETIHRYKYPRLGLFTGKTANHVYHAFIEKFTEEVAKNGISFKNVEAFIDGEIFGLAPEHPHSYQNMIKNDLLNKIERIERLKLKTENIHFISGILSEGTIKTHCENFDMLLRGKTIHTQLMGVAPDGQTMFLSVNAFNEIDELLNQKTSLIKLSDSTYKYISPTPITPYVFSIGSGNILSLSDRIVLLAFGENKSKAISKLLFDKINPKFPVSILKKHEQLIIVIDRDCLDSFPDNWETSIQANVMYSENLNYLNFFHDITSK